MKPLDPEKLLAVLRAQQYAIDALNDASTERSSCGCCSGNSPAYSEVREARERLDELEKQASKG